MTVGVEVGHEGVGPAIGWTSGRKPDRGVSRRLSAWLPVLLGVAIIALESTDFMGAEHTSGPLRKIFEAIFGRVTDARWEIEHHLIRKSGHFLGYGAIGLAWLRAWWMTVPSYGFFRDALR